MSFSVPAFDALIFFVACLPICLYVMYTDLSEMRIPNTMVLAMLALFIVVGPFLLPIDEYLWRFSHFAIVLVVGYLLHVIAGIGAGDVKFAAAMAPFFAASDWATALLLYAIFSVAGLILHKIARRITPIKKAAAGWMSFDEEQGHFPLGISLAAMHLFYLGYCAFINI